VCKLNTMVTPENGLLQNYNRFMQSFMFMSKNVLAEINLVVIFFFDHIYMYFHFLFLFIFFEFGIDPMFTNDGYLSLYVYRNFCISKKTL